MYFQSEAWEPFQNLTRLKHQDYVAEVGFHRLLVRKIRRALGPILLDFFAPSAIFFHKWRKGASWAEPLKALYPKEYTCEIWKLFNLPFKSYDQCKSVC